MRSAVQKRFLTWNVSKTHEASTTTKTPQAIQVTRRSQRRRVASSAELIPALQSLGKIQSHHRRPRQSEGPSSAVAIETTSNRLFRFRIDAERLDPPKRSIMARVDRIWVVFGFNAHQIKGSRTILAMAAGRQFGATQGTSVSAGTTRGRISL